jgi:hypothetical protein
MLFTKAVREFFRDPPPDSKVRAALDFGIDLSLTVRNMFAETIEQRLLRLESHLEAPFGLEKRAKKPDSG